MQAPQEAGAGGYFRTSLVLAVLPFLVAISAMVLRLGFDDGPVTYGYALGAFLLAAPALHVAGMGYALVGAMRGFGRMRGTLCILFHVLIISFEIPIGAATLIGASA